MPEDLSQASSIYQLMILTAWADGQLDAAEALVTHDLLARMPELQRVSERDELARAAKEKLDSLGLVAALTDAARGLRDDAQREQAFLCCARVLEADGKIALEEFRVLGTLRQLFGLSDEAVERLLAEAAR
jgi:uncharacterized tellurite resistance protein B-like protein